MNIENEYCCANCEEHEATNDSRKIYCKYYKTYYDKTDSCSNIKRIVKTEEETACYITTIVCGLLRYNDDCSLLQTLRGFRDNVMQNDPKYKEILFEYDTVGRQISNLLLRDFFKPKDKEPDEFIVSLYKLYLQPTARLVTEKKYEEAVEKYTKMTKSLEDYYSINVGQTVPQDYDYSQGGHGLYKKIGPGPLI